MLASLSSLTAPASPSPPHCLHCRPPHAFPSSPFLSPTAPPPHHHSASTRIAPAVPSGPPQGRAAAHAALPQRTCIMLMRSILPTPEGDGDPSLVPNYTCSNSLAIFCVNTANHEQAKGGATSREGGGASTPSRLEPKAWHRLLDGNQSFPCQPALPSPEFLGLAPFCEPGSSGKSTSVCPTCSTSSHCLRVN